MPILNLPYQFADGENLDPNKINDNFQHLLDSIDLCASKRYHRSSVCIPLFKASGTGLTQADGYGLRKWRLPVADPVVIERLFITGAMASGSATLNVYVASTGLAPSGVVNPIATISNTTFDSVVINSDLKTSVDLNFTLEGTTFATSQIDLTLHLRADRYDTTSVTSVSRPSFDYYEHGNTATDTIFNTKVSGIASAITANVAADRALKYSYFEFRDIVSGTDSDLRRIDIPVAGTTSTRGGVQVAKIHKIAAFASLASAGGVGDAITVDLQNASGSSLHTLTVSYNGLTEANGITSAINQSLSGSASAESTVANDHRIVIANNDAVINADLIGVWVLWS